MGDGEKKRRGEERGKKRRPRGDTEKKVGDGLRGEEAKGEGR